MNFEPADLADPGVLRLLERHLTRNRAESPPESMHALDVEGLRAPDVTLWAARDDGALLALGALKQLTADHGELKSMFVDEARRRSGAGSAMVAHLCGEARRLGMTRVSLETGSMDYFAPARAMYAKHGFVECGIFGGYRPDPNSVFMTRALA